MITFIRKPLVIIIIIAIVFLAFSYLIYQTRQAQEEKYWREQLQVDISSQISLYKSGEAPNIDLSKLTSFSWDRLYIFGPYVPLDIIQKRLGSSWRPSTPILLGSDTSFTLLVFTRNGEVIQYIDYPLELGNFSEAGEKTDGYARHEAVFVMNDYGYILWLNR